MKCVFLTGATGVLGSALVPLFVEDTDTRLILLMRSDSQQNLERRLIALFDFWEFDRHDSSIVRRVEAIRGDVCAAKFGLSNDSYDRLANEVTHIIHSAGNVKLNQSLNDARRFAVDSARNVFDLAKACQSQGQFRKLEFVSTVGVAGATPGLIEERPYDEPRQFHNTYEAAKAEAESFAWAQICDGIPGTIHRPSMIVGDSKTGKTIRFQVFYHLADFLAGLRTWGIVPQTGDSKLDIIPVDYVARAIYISSASGVTEGRILHLNSGPDHSWTLNDLIVKLRRLLDARGQQIPPLRQVRPRWARWFYRAVAPVVPARKRRFLQGLPYFLDYLDERQLFENSKTNAILARTGLKIPAVADYLDVVMGAYWKSSNSVRV